MTLKKDASIYFCGIGGTGMAAVAGLCREAGFKVTGSDAGVYPPMSTMLADLGVSVRIPYQQANLSGVEPDLVVIANVLSRGNVELEEVLRRNLPYTSFPQLLGDQFLKNSASCVVAGTHGKTTTTSLLAHVLHELGEDPSFIVGGIPRNFPYSFRLGKSPLFVIEGDEYDTAFFDKGPKFLHYHPKHLILNNLEYDHADIYPNVEAIEAQFAKLIALVPNRKSILANIDDPGINRLIDKLGMQQEVTRVAAMGAAEHADVTLKSHKAQALPGGQQLWTAYLSTKQWGDLVIETTLSGRHNLANTAQVVACLASLEQSGDLTQPVDKARLGAAFRSFSAPMRRLDLLASRGGIDVYEDFAHHPTAVRFVLEGFRTVYPNKRLIVAFEPRSASQRRNVFQADFAKSLALADRVYIGECPQDKRIPEAERMDTSQMQAQIGGKAKAFATNADLLTELQTDVTAGDAVIFMSSGSFSGAQHELAKNLAVKFNS